VIGVDFLWGGGVGFGGWVFRKRLLLVFALLKS